MFALGLVVWTSACDDSGGEEDPETCQPTASGIEICDDIDNDCNGMVDEGCDADGDGFCDGDASFADPENPPAVCSMGIGDCDDDDGEVNPSSVEVCDDIDNDCDGTIDPDCDVDGDGYCAPDVTVVGSPQSCAEGTNDCDDAVAEVNPAATEVCDDIDNDCNDEIDEVCDLDGDTVCAPDATVVGTPASCAGGTDDCDDSDPNISPLETEVCDEIDNNCNDEIDEDVQMGYVPDADGDQFGDETATPTQGCMPPMGFVLAGGEPDCDDTRDDVYPGAPETCGPVDMNCDGTIPYPVLQDPVAVRGHPNLGDGGDAADDGTNFGLVWVEELSLNRVAHFAVINPGGNVLQGPVALSDPTYPVTHVSIEWNETLGVYGIAMNRIEGADTAGIYFLTLDTDGNIVDPVERIADTTRSRPVRVVATGATFSVLYRSTEASVAGVRHVHWHEAGMVSSPVLLARDVALTAVSAAYHESATTPHLIAAWRDEDTAATPVFALGHTVLDLSTDTILIDQGRTSFPNDITPLTPVIYDLGAQAYVIWYEQGATFTEDLLQVAPFDETGAFGATTTLVSDIRRSFARRQGLTEIDADTRAVFFRDRRADGTQGIFLARFDGNWDPIGTPVETPLDGVVNDLRASHRMFGRASYVYVLRQDAQDGYVDWLGLDFSGGIVTAAQPIFADAFEPEIHERQATWYDSDTDTIKVIQIETDVTQSSIAEFSADGTLLSVTDIATPPTTECEPANVASLVSGNTYPYGYDDLGISCVEFAPEFDPADPRCSMEPDGSFTPTYRMLRHTYNSNDDSWDTIDAGSVDGAITNFFGYDCRAPVSAAQAIRTDIGTLFGVVPGGTFGAMGSELRHVVEATGEIQVTPLSEPSESTIVFPFAFVRGDTRILLITVIADDSIDLAKLNGWLIDTATGEIVGDTFVIDQSAGQEPFDLLSASAFGNGYWDGEKFVIIYPWVASSTMTETTFSLNMRFIREDGTVEPTPDPVQVDTDIAVERPVFTAGGVVDYHSLLGIDAAGTELRFILDDGTDLTSSTVDYVTSEPNFEPVNGLPQSIRTDDGRIVMLLSPDDERDLFYPTMCGTP